MQLQLFKLTSIIIAFGVPKLVVTFATAGWSAQLYSINLTKDYKKYLQADHEREERVVEFIESIIHEKPKGDFQSFIKDAVVLSK